MHFWSFWGGGDGPLYELMRAEAVAFVMAKTDGNSCPIAFALAITSATNLPPTKRGGELSFDAARSDIGTRASFGGTQPASRLDFVRQLPVHGRHPDYAHQAAREVYRVRILGAPTTDRHAVLEGSGHTTFSACHFIGWGQRDTTAPAIHAHRGG